MMGTMSLRQPENWLYEIWQKGQDSPCYVMVPNAKDLVKSHLMIAVREEVEVLKEKISELMDKINQLEVENTILKSNMPQETLQQLQMQKQLQITGSTPTNGSNMIMAAPTSAAITAASAAIVAANAGANQQQYNAAAAATSQTNVGSGTATPTTQQPTTGGGAGGEQFAAQNDNKGSAQASNKGLMS